MKKFFSLAVASMLLGSVVVSCGDNTPKLDPANPFATEWTAQNGMPPFDKIQVSHIIPALKVGIAQEAAEINQIANNSEKPTFENTILAFQNTGKLLSRVGTAYGALKGTEMNDELRAIQKEYLSLSSEHSSNITLNAKLFDRIKAVYEGREKENYNPLQLRLIEKTYDRFARNGANLSAEDKEKIRKINAELSTLSMNFGDNVLNENNKFRLFIDNEKDLAGLPAGVIATAAELAKKEGQEGKWAFTLKKPSYIPFMQYAKNRDLRKVMFEGYSNVANHNDENDNKEIIKKTVALRLQKAQLFGYKNFAEYNLVNSVIKTPEAVYEFIEGMWPKVIKKAKTEIKDMQKLMNNEGIKGKIQPWDWFYYAEKVRSSKYSLDENQIKEYFEAKNVRDGLFYVAGQLYGLTFQPVENAVRINPETQVFDVYDKDGSFLSVLTFDFYPRASKRGGAWCSRLKSQEYVDGKRVAPIVTITCNFSAPYGDTPGLFTMDEVSTAFHEFGHAIQGMLTDIKYPGLTGNPRDFVEFPSQIDENWAFQPEVLEVYAKHYKTGEVIPNSLIKKIQNLGSFNQGFANGENLSASYLDMKYHTMESLEEINAMDVAKFEAETLATLGIIPEFIPRYRSTYFNHVFSGGYAAGYYCYKYSEIMSADGFAAFEESGDIFNPEIALSLRNIIMSKGSSRDEKEMYLEWRGKEPDPKYLMKALGLN